MGFHRKFVFSVPEDASNWIKVLGVMLASMCGAAGWISSMTRQGETEETMEQRRFG